MIDLIENLLLQADSKVLAQHSRMDHHAVGMHYLCLHRSDALTVKIYHITEQAQNNNSGYLIHPHNHRYMFDTVVLDGFINHKKFGIMSNKARPNCGHFETRLISGEEGFRMFKKSDVALIPTSTRFHTTAEQHRHYRVMPSDIHTLEVVGECVLGLIQYADSDLRPSIFLPLGMKASEIDCTGSVMTEEQYAIMANALVKKLKTTPFSN